MIAGSGISCICRRTGTSVRVGVTAIVVVACGNCASGSPKSDSEGRVSGHVLAGPTCPVERPGDTNCGPAPVQGKVQFTQDGDVIDSVAIDPIGDYSLEVPAGIYTLTVDTGDSIFPTCSPVEVEVLSGVEVKADVFCDTGIR